MTAGSGAAKLSRRKNSNEGHKRPNTQHFKRLSSCCRAFSSMFSLDGISESFSYSTINLSLIGFHRWLYCEKVKRRLGYRNQIRQLGRFSDLSDSTALRMVAMARIIETGSVLCFFGIRRIYCSDNGRPSKVSTASKLPHLGAKISAVLISGAVFILFIAGIAWPFRCAALVQALEACEEVLITIQLPALQGNVHSLWHAKRIKKRLAEGLITTHSVL